MKQKKIIIPLLFALFLTIQCGDESAKKSSSAAIDSSYTFDVSGKLTNWSSFLSYRKYTADAGVFVQAVVIDESTKQVSTVCSDQSKILSDGSFSITLSGIPAKYLRDVSEVTAYDSYLTAVPASGVLMFNYDEYEIEIHIFKPSVFGSTPAISDSVGSLDYDNGIDCAAFDYSLGAVTLTGETTLLTFVIKDNYSYQKGWNWRSQVTTYDAVSGLYSSNGFISQSAVMAGYEWSIDYY